MSEHMMKMTDLIERKAAIDAVSRGCGELRGIFAECEKNLNELPSAQTEIKPHRNYKYLSDYWCKCGWHLGKKGSVKYCADCGQKVKWDE